MRPRLCALLLLGLLAVPVRLSAVGPAAKDVAAVRDKAIAFLARQQLPDGSFSPEIAGPGVTAIAIAALVRNGKSADDPVVARALAYLEKSAKKDGGIYDKTLANYTTSVAILALKEANVGGKYDALIKRATKFLKSLQDNDVDNKELRFGGVGYDGKGRPDLSNTHHFVESLLAAGVSKDDPAIKNALVFMGRCQNLAGEFNDQPFAKKARPEDKGGFVYDPSGKDKRTTPEGGLRSAGSMTYAGLKSFLYAGVKKDDPRVVAAIDWVRRHYSLEENVGMGDAGLYYYYHLFAKALDAWGEDMFRDARGTAHDWRQDLFDALRKRQLASGGFRGTRAFGESDANLATSFALLSLSYVKAPAR